ncbi:hypothetical protein [Fodinibius sp. Rm-B-1B1-1]|uniref:hypothetical protein n=1 Tax=Fodinibius alkaliphilus TaxID=3140241 RepID=UPI00315A4BFF
MIKYPLIILIFGVCLSFLVEIKTFEDSIEGDRQALMDLYEATGGTGWHNDSGWGSGNPDNSWHGIEVDGQGRVVEVNLRSNGLQGELPESLGNLTKVTYFNVKQNRLSGTLPWNGIGNMTSLQYLLLNGRTVDPRPNEAYHHPGKDLSGSYSDERTNDFTGSMGAQVGNLSNLIHLELMGVNSDHTGLTGPIPKEIGKLTKLEGLFLSYNSFDSLPTSMSNLTNLYQFGIIESKLTGELPSWIANWTKLKYLLIEDNGFSGSIPDLSNLSDLQAFIAKKNAFTGEIPRYFFDGTMPKINMVDLGFNELTGTLPEFGTPNNLKALQLDGNQLTGKVPESVKNIDSIKNFGLGWNNLEGQIPDLSNLHQLRYLRANDNNFTGAPPMVDTSNGDLQFIHLQENNLSGEVPKDLSKLAYLPKFKEIDLRNNNFSDSDVELLMEELTKMGKTDLLRY